MTTTAETTAGYGKRVRSFRMHDDTWDLIADRGARDAASAFVNDMTEAGLGYARCYRCFTLVPVKFGNLAGRPLAEWVAEAGKTVTRQKCKDHRPVRIGFETGDAAVAEASLELLARAEQAEADARKARVAAAKAEARLAGTLKAQAAAEQEAVTAAEQEARAERREARAERNARIRAMRAEGASLREIAAETGVTRQRIAQILSKSPAPPAAAVTLEPQAIEAAPPRPKGPPGSAWLETDPDEIPRIEDVLNPRRRKGRDR